MKNMGIRSIPSSVLDLLSLTSLNLNGMKSGISSIQALAKVASILEISSSQLNSLKISYNCVVIWKTIGIFKEVRKNDSTNSFQLFKTGMSEGKRKRMS